jgi:hypothetical protein
MNMARIEISLNRLEARLRAVIERESPTKGIPRKFHQQLVHELDKAMRAALAMKQVGNGLDHQLLHVPDQYTLVLPTDQAQLLLNHPSELDLLAQHLQEAAAQKGVEPVNKPILRVVADPAEKGLRVTAASSQPGLGDSMTSELDHTRDFSSGFPQEVPLKAFLIVNGLTTYPLTQTVINIGSNPENHLVVEQPGVAYYHAQLRFVTDHFVIFDLDSSSGTFVNGLAVTSHALNPGDVILLAGVPLVYGHDATPPVGYTQEMPSGPPALEIL